MSVSAMDCAREVLEVVPFIMRVIRAQMRSYSAPELSVPQFRTLAFLNRNPGSSLSDVAEHIGLTLPTMSKLVDSLVMHQLVTREVSQADRRCIILGLTSAGQTTFQAARQATQIQLAQLLAGLTDSERETITQAMQILRPVFTPEHEPELVRER